MVYICIKRYHFQKNRTVQNSNSLMMGLQAVINMYNLPIGSLAGDFVEVHEAICIRTY